MLDRNGYSDSIFPLEQNTCYVCGRVGDINRHEVYFGTGNRAISKAHGFWVNLCPPCHSIIHGKPDDGKLDLELKEKCQREYEKTHTRAEFMKLIGKNYLE